MMHTAVASAASGDPSSMNMVVIFGGIFMVAATSVLAFILIYISRARRHRQAEFITTTAIFWALIALGSLLYAGESQMDWSKDYTMQLQTGYLDPQNTSDEPSLPWKTWTGLGVAYGVLLMWSLSQKRVMPPGP